MNLSRERIPAALAERTQWCLWKLIEREADKPTKLPFMGTGQNA